MILTRDRAMAEKIDMLRRFGGSTRYRHERLGYNSRLDELQAAVLRVKLRSLGAWNARRQQIAALYDRLLAALPLCLPQAAPGVVHVYQEYTIRAPQRDALQAFLKARGIETGVYYPLPLHLQELYLDLGLGKGRFPEAERAAAEVLSLPIYPEMGDDSGRDCGRRDPHLLRRLTRPDNTRLESPACSSRPESGILIPWIKPSSHRVSVASFCYLAG